jgi:hypothetical protein
MAALSDHSEKLLLDWLFTNGTAVRPTAWYIALYTAPPSDSGGGTELSGSGYARGAVTFAPAASPAGTTSNSNAVTFTASGSSWGVVSHMGLFDAVTSGNLLVHGSLAAPLTIGDGDAVVFAIGSVELALA